MQDTFDFLTVVLPTKAEKIVLMAGGFFGIIASYIVGDIDDAIIWLLLFILADYLTGMYAALKTRAVSSKQGFAGLFKKAFIFVIVAICHGMDVIMETNSIRDGAVIAYAINEAVSIIENAERAGLGGYIPAPVRRVLHEIKDKREGDAEGEDQRETGARQ